jgi:hypothetical protein
VALNALHCGGSLPAWWSRVAHLKIPELGSGLHSLYSPKRVSTVMRDCWYTLKLGMLRIGTLAQVTMPAIFGSAHKIGIASSYLP